MPLQTDKKKRLGPKQKVLETGQSVIQVQNLKQM